MWPPISCWPSLPPISSPFSQGIELPTYLGIRLTSHNATAVMLAGRDTTASLLGWSLVRLTLHPEIFSSLRATVLADFPDANLAESIQRVPGVSIARDAGEGRQITVRGLGPQFTRVRINGVEGQSTASGTDSSGGANRNRAFWGGSSYTPLPLKGIKRKGFGRNG